MFTRRVISILLVLLAAAGGPLAVRAAAAGPADDAGPTPPRLSYVNGEASFWRPGTQDWVAAQVNMPLAPNDELYTGTSGTIEVQIGPRTFARMWANTQTGVVNQEPDFMQVKVTAGHASLDLRAIEPGRTIELDTPHAAFTIEHTGYYRVDVTPERTQFITRRGGRATMTPPSGAPMAIASSEELVVEGIPSPQVQAYVAPELDTWDRWNYARTDQLIDSVSARYVSADVYGVSDLDHYGTWRVVPTYGSVWVPDNEPTGWVPYSTGSWVWDSSYSWTWVDTAPWGWAPYHYGRWVFVDRFWAWAPGPLVARPVYTPALVVFFGVGPGIRVAGGPAIAWCPLSWGEPLIPWWGRPGFAGVPWWGGWGGPRVVNNVVINNTTIVNSQNITVYRNAAVHQGIVAVDRDHFGTRPVQETRVTGINAQGLTPVRGPLQVKPTQASLVPDLRPAPQPPREMLARPVVATRAPRPPRAPVAVQGEPNTQSTAVVPTPVPAPRLVSPPKGANQAVVSPRPPLGQSPIERPRSPMPAPPSGELQQPNRGTDRGETHQSGEPTRAPGPQRPTPAITTPGPPAPPQPPTTPPQMTRPAPVGAPPPRPAEPQGATPTAPGRPMPPAAPSVRPEPRPAAPAPTSPPAMTRPGPEVRPEPRRVEPQGSAPAAPPQAMPPAPPQVRPQPSRPEPRGTAPAPAVTPQAPPAGRQDAPVPPTRVLPGDPANRLYPGRTETRSPGPPQISQQRAPNGSVSHGHPGPQGG